MVIEHVFNYHKRNTHLSIVALNLNFRNEITQQDVKIFQQDKLKIHNRNSKASSGLAPRKSLGVVYLFEVMDVTVLANFVWPSASCIPCIFWTGLHIIYKQYPLALFFLRIFSHSCAFHTPTTNSQRKKVPSPFASAGHRCAAL